MGIRDKTEMYKRIRINRTKDMIIGRRHRIQGRDTDIRKRKPTLEKERIHRRTQINAS